ncbi:hypothetical protein AWB64_01822 [Caballeronia sordidicola]|uniref:DUF4148 domain-containing protein n=1 Tax=Caballeronia sordidicola TaxID=196367 RepID=A0A158FU45_CABSO|nr:DUF4148 domain-containing protein [Caballeronia sordidicola]SAL23345.1 hypothetical protein AWB64_01822 [Caballeronia sordidicola]
MKTVIAALSLSAVSALVSTTAFADGGIGRAGTYQTTATSESTMTRAQVRAELAAAYANGTLPALNRNTYPDRSMAGIAIAEQHEQRARDAALAEQRNRSIVEFANGSATQSGKPQVQ